MEQKTVIRRDKAIVITRFIQECRLSQLGPQLVEFLEAVSDAGGISFAKDIASMYEEPSPLEAEFKKIKRNSNLVHLNDVEEVIKNIKSFKYLVSEIVKRDGLRVTAKRIGIDPSNLATFIHKSLTPRYSTVRKIAVGLQLSSFKKMKS